MLRLQHRVLSAVIFTVFALGLSAAGAQPASPPKPTAGVQAILDAGSKAEKAAPQQLDVAEKLFAQALSEARKLHDVKGQIEALRLLGIVASDRPQNDKALDYYQQSLTLSRTNGDKEGQALALLDIAIVYRDGQPAKAIPICQEAIPLFREVGNRVREAGTLFVLASSLAATGKYDEAHEGYKQALAIYTALNDVQGQANTLFFLGGLYSFDQIQAGNGRPTADQAIGYYDQAIQLLHKLNNPVLEGRVHTFVAGIHFYQGNFDAARPRFEKALAIFREAKDLADIAYALNGLSNIYSLQDRPVDALRCDQEALDIYRKSGDKGGEAGELIHIADLYTRVGQQRTALQNYLKALPLAQQAGNIDNQVTILNSISEVYEILGDHKTAVMYARQVVTLLEKPTSALFKQRNLGVLAGIYFQMKDYQKARDILEQQLAALEKSGFTAVQSTTVSLLGMAEKSLGHLDKALEYYRRELKAVEATGDSLSLASTLSSIAEIEEEQGDLESAERDTGAAIEKLEASRASLGGLSEAKSTFLTANLSTYRQYLALLLRRNKSEAAFALVQKMKGRALLDILYDGKVQIAGLLTPEEREQEKVLRQKSDALNYQLVKEGVQNEIGSKKRAEAIKLQIADAERDLQVFEDALYTRHPDLAQKRAAKTITLDETANFLPEDTALLEYVSLKVGKADETVLFVVTQQAGHPTLSTHILPIKQASLTPQVSALREACSDPRKPYRAAAQALYHTLIAPAESQLAGKKRLLICPDGILWDVPFAALLSGSGSSSRASGQFLMQKFEIVYAYSATGAEAELTAESRGQRSQARQTMLAFANPNFGDEQRFGDDPDIPGQRPIGAPSRPIGAPSRPIGAPSRPIGAPSRPIGAPSRPIGAPSRPIGAPSRPIGAPSRPIGAPSRDLFLPRGGYLAQLPGTQQEARAIKTDFPDAVVYTKDAAQESVAKREAGNYRYLHFATHGFFNDAAPLLSAIVLALPDKKSGDDGFLTAREIFDLNLSADMVVLSACNTARGEKRNGEGMIGLTWALFAAGAPTQVVSQWSVNDASTALLMQRFYANLTKKQEPKGEALRHAALSLLNERPAPKGKHPIPNTEHPYYWAPFILLGNWK